jgi:hypothetical protein
MKTTTFLTVQFKTEEEYRETSEGTVAIATIRLGDRKATSAVAVPVPEEALSRERAMDAARERLRRHLRFSAKRCACAEEAV